MFVAFPEKRYTSKSNKITLRTQHLLMVGTRHAVFVIPAEVGVALAESATT